MGKCEKIKNSPEIRGRLKEVQENIYPRSQEKFANNGRMTGSGYRKIIYGDTAYIKITTLEDLCNGNNININYVLNGEGPMFTTEDVTKNKNQQQETNEEENNNGYIDGIIREVEKLHPIEQKRIYNIILAVAGEEERAKLVLSIATLPNLNPNDLIGVIKREIFKSILNNTKEESKEN